MTILGKVITTALAGVVITTTLLSTACNKPVSNNNTYVANVTGDDLADAISAGMAANSNGIAAEATAICNYSTAKGLFTITPAMACGSSADTGYTRSNSTAVSSYNYSIDLTYLLACKRGAPDSLAVTENMNGAFNLPTISGSDATTATFAVTGLQSSSPTITVNGTYTRTGIDSSKVRTKANFSSIITYTLTNVTVSKSTQQITGGTGSVTITGASKGVAYANSAYLTFNSSGLGSITLGGNAYNVVLYP